MPDQLTIEAWLRLAAKQIENTGSSTPDFDTKLLLMEVAGFSAVDLISRRNEPLEPEMIIMADALVKRRVNGEPVHRILGWREFYGRKFHLSDETLIPRPDTEALIDVVLRLTSGKSESLRILDIGTGSGIIAITLAAELPNVKVLGIDISQDALHTAAKNAQRLGVRERVNFASSDLFQQVDETFDLIVSNPPYIPDCEIVGLQREVKFHDPGAALAGGEDGLEFYRHIFAEAKGFLVSNGLVCVEIGAGQGQAVCDIMQKNAFEIVEKAPDLSGIERVIVGKCS